MNFIPFEQWIDNNPDLVQQVEDDCKDCDVCNGEGACWVCANECQNCNTLGQRDKLRKLYNEQKDAQIKKLKEWEDAMRGVA